MKSTTKVPNGHGSLYKEVRFSPTVTPILRAQSVSTSNPSADSQFPGRTSVGESYSALSAAYLQQSQMLLGRQRESFEKERAIFAEERLLWERERDMLKMRISELESLLLKSRGPDASTSIPHRSQLAPLWSAGASEHNNYFTHDSGNFSPVTKATRVFHEAEKLDGHLAPTTEQGGSLPSLDAALSPRSSAIDHPACGSVSVPIEKLDSELDGITLKSTALPPEIVARVMTPPSPAPSDISPSVHPRPNMQQRPSMERKNSLKLKLSDLGAPDRNRTRDAGHTPMAIIDGDPDVEQLPSGEAPAEGPDHHRPAESAQSYFPGVQDEDPALTGPLSLLNDENHDKGFLNELNLKLLSEAKQLVGDAPNPKEQDEDPELLGGGEAEPELKFKKTTNFGTAFGQSG